MARLMPGHCYFCLAGVADGRPWCGACVQQLARNLHACPRCAEPLPASAVGPCGRCLRTPPTFERAYVPFIYEDDLARLIHRYKFHADLRAGRLLLMLLLKELEARPTFLHHCVLVPVPLHPARARARGFDQAGWLARQLSRRLKLPLRRAYRLKDTPSQRGLKRKARLRNVADAFAFEGPLPPHVVLFDDVMTTGATFEALARACRNAGAQHVGVLALARTPSGAP